MDTNEVRADFFTKKAIKESREKLGITSAEAADRITEAGYKISHGSYRNIESNAPRSARVNIPMIMAIAQAFECPVSALVRPQDLPDIPKKARYNGKRTPKEKGPVTKTEGGQNGRWPTFAKEIVDLHKPDPVDQDCCGGCEMLWPCSTYEIIERKGFQNL